MAGTRLAQVNALYRRDCHSPALSQTEEEPPVVPLVSAVMAFTQLDPPIPLNVIDRGSGFAIAVIDYGQEFDLMWVVGMDEGGEIWCVPNPQVRLQINWSMGRTRKDPKAPHIAAVAG